jgi:predicted DNA-binding antitoxin AbrB/MazE fold protein
MLFFDDYDGQILDIIEKIELKVKEIKEVNHFILPESIRHNYFVIYSTNIFSLVKKIQLKEGIQVNKLTNNINKIINLSNNSSNNSSNKNEIEELNKEQNKILEEIIYIQSEYLNLDEKFNNEIAENMKKFNKWFIFKFLLCDWLKS